MSINIKRALNRPIDGDAVGTKWVTNLGTAWVDLDASDFASMDGATLASNYLFVTLDVKNITANTNLFVLYQSGTGISTASAQLLEPGDAFTADLSGFNTPNGVTTIGVVGGGANAGYAMRATFLSQ